jgi:putative ABC transport system permease protein
MSPKNWKYTIPLRLRSLFRRRHADEELDEELRDHILRKTDENVTKGMTPQEARRQALLGFGGVEKRKEECRETRRVNWLQDLAQDLRYALRMLRKAPGFTAVAVLTLALGIGANTAIFSVVYAVLLRPLPYAHSQQLVFLSPRSPKSATGLTYPAFAQLREQNHAFTEIAASAFHNLVLTGRGEPAEVSTISVTPQIFSMLGAKPLLGRTFRDEDNKQGAAPVVILSGDLWRSQFGADPNIVGSTLELDHRSFTVVGVMPAGFVFPPLSDRRGIWVPIMQDPVFGSWMVRTGAVQPVLWGRLKPGVSLAQAQAEMNTISAQLNKLSPPNETLQTIRVTPMQEAFVRGVKSALLVLLGAVGLVLLIACANIANLLLSRAISRTKEIAVRAALGAGRARLIRQLLTESAVLGVLGAVAGIALAYWGVRGLSSFLPADLPLVNAIRVDGWVLLFALLLALTASLLFGLAPALLAADCNFQNALKDAARGSGESGRGRRARSLLAAAEIALAMALVVAAGLLLRSFAALTDVNPGFNPQHVLQAEVSLPRFQYSKPEQWTNFANELLARVQAVPGLQDSAFGAPLPLAPDGFITLGFSIAGSPAPQGLSSTADYASVSANYFHVMGIPLLRGRFFSAEDSFTAPRVAVISEALAHTYFPNEDPVGRRLTFGFPPDGNVTREIVGVAGDVRDESLSKTPGPMMYVPFAQEPFWGGIVVSKTTLATSSAVASIRQAVDSIDDQLPITDVGLLSDNLNDSVAQPRFRTLLLGLFGALALVLAAAGIFGVISYSVSCRTRELGIRMALGAPPSAIRRMVLREGLRIALTGLVVGLVAAFALTRLLKGQLYGIGATDPYTFAGAAILLVGVALLACYIPARRAMKVDPMVALRYE